ncbi:LAFA_0D07360g1_1 [Lachancea sp. 'fantastica']|nr:LAFA_0D07360g1_1 [Lachancea sp. 'fantastica']
MVPTTAEKLSQILIAKYLAKHEYDAALLNFLKESGLSRSAVDMSSNEFEDLEKIIAERIEFNETKIGARLANLTLNDAISPLDPKFNLPSWDHTQKLNTLALEEKPTSLAVDLSFTGDSQLSVSTVDRNVYFYGSDLSLAKKLKSNSGVVKRCGTFSRGNEMWYYVCGMNGNLTIFDGNFDIQVEHQLHSRIVKNIEFFHLTKDSKCYCFSSGLDNYVKVHLIDLENFEITPVVSLKLTTPCTSFQLAQTQEELPTLLLTHQDYSQLVIYVLHGNQLVETHKLAMNNAQFSSHSFNVQSSCILNFGDENNTTSGESPNHHLPTLRNGSMVAVATSHVPYMRVILLEVPEIGLHSASQIYYDKILRNMATMIPQDSFSSAILKTCQQPGGLIVGSDSGVYGIDVANCDSWLLVQGERRVKAIDSFQDQLAIAYGNSELEVLYWRQEA